MATDQEYSKKLSDEERLEKLQLSLKALKESTDAYEQRLEDTEKFYEDENRRRTLHFSNQQMEQQLFQQMIDQKSLDTKYLPPEVQQQLTAESGNWIEENRKQIEAYKASDGTKEIKPGTMSTFDQKAADIVERGNAYTAVPFLNQARQLAAERYAAFEEKQAAYDREIEEKTAQGDLTKAQVLEARKTYEAAAYERDTAQSVLAKYEVLYGVESKNYKEQAADVETLTAQADDMYVKLEAVTSMDANIRKALEAETLVEKTAEVENQPQVETPEQVIESPETEVAEQEIQSPMLNRLHDRIVERQEDEAFEEGWQEFQSNEIQPPTTEADDAEAHADEIIRAMDEGRDPYSDGYDEYEAQQGAAEAALERGMSGEVDDDHDSDGDAQIAEDRHFQAEMPQDLEFEAPEDHDREYEMAPVHRYEEQDAERSQSQSMSSASLTQEFSDSDRQRLDQMKERSNTAMENMAKASDTGDDRALHAARKELASANSEFQDYLADRREFKTAMTEFNNAADRLTKNGGELDSAEARKFERTYKDANSAIDRMEADDKPWAGEMRQHLRAVGETHVEKEKASKNDDAPRSSSMSTIMRKSDSDRETQHEARIVEYTPPPVQTQQDQDKDRLVQH